MNTAEIESIAREKFAAAEIDGRYSELINFAFLLLDNKIESENIFILAGLNSKNYDDEIKKYFWLVIEEQNITINCENIDYYYLCYVNRKVQSGEMKPQQALSKLYSINDEWNEFDESVSLLEEGIYYSLYDLNLKDLDSYICEKLFLDVELYKKPLPKDFKDSAFCRKCGKLVIPKREAIQLFFKNRIYYKCPLCKSCSQNYLDLFVWCCDNKGKKLYLEKFEK